MTKKAKVILERARVPSLVRSVLSSVRLARHEQEYDFVVSSDNKVRDMTRSRDSDSLSQQGIRVLVYQSDDELQQIGRVARVIANVNLDHPELSLDVSSRDFDKEYVAAVVRECGEHRYVDNRFKQSNGVRYMGRDQVLSRPSRVRSLQGGRAY